MRITEIIRVVHILCAAGVLGLLPITPARADPETVAPQSFPDLPLPPAVDGLIGFPQTYTKGRITYLSLITSEADQRGLPAAMADAVVKVESGFNPNVVGGVGEVGLMQIRPQTAAMLGYKGGLTGLFEPETNVRFGVAYLARAWELARGDVCRTLMKYRAGWGEERMTPLSVEYCRRARGHLAAIGSPLAEGAPPPTSTEPATPFAPRQANRVDQVFTVPPASASQATNRQPSTGPIRFRTASLAAGKQHGGQAYAKAPAPNAAMLGPKPVVSSPRGADTSAIHAPIRIGAPPLPPARIRVASVGAMKLSEAQAKALLIAREHERVRSSRHRQIWVEHDIRIKTINAKLKTPQLRIMSGL